MLPDSVSDAIDPPLHYTRAGTGPILLLIHGSLCDYRYWRWQIPALSSQYTVLAPSLRGYWPQALTRPDPCFSVSQHAQDLAGFIKDVGLGRPIHVLGHSRGAQVAFELASQVPDLVASLTLADPGFRLLGEPATTGRHADIAELLVNGQPEAALSRFVDTVNGPGTWRQMVGWFKTMVRDNAFTLLSQAQEPDTAIDPARIDSTRLPVLLLGGAQSPERYGERLNALQKSWPQAERASIPMAAHGMNLANPKAFNSIISVFLNSIQS